MSTQHQPGDDTAALDATGPTAGPSAGPTSATDTATSTPTLQLPTSQPPTSPPSVETTHVSDAGATGRTPDEPTTTPVRGDGAPAVPVRATELHPLRVGTVVWGLVLAFLGVGVLAWAGDRSIDVGLAAILLVAGAGLALLVGSLVTGARQRRRGGTAD